MSKKDKGWKNQLFFADNLEVLKRYHAEYPKGFIDLIYNDPPFNSKRNYSVLFETIDMTDTKAQREAFADTWSNISYYDTLSELQDLNPDTYNYLTCLNNLAISKGSVSYLTIMAIRIYYMHKLLKDTGSFYLHCDPTMSHYLKIICDLIFGEKNFRNEIIWKRAETIKGNFGQGTKNFDPNTDTILFFTKSFNNTFNQPFKEYTKEYITNFYKYIESDTNRIYRLISMTAPGDAAKGNPEYEVMGVKRFWRYSEKKMKELIENGMVVQTNPGNVPQRKQYLDIGLGVPIQTFWNDIKALSAQDAERLGYPTQKPKALLERIINASSNKGDLVADFFCGCGTTIAVAQRLKRRWIGVDISHLAINLIEKKRLKEPYKNKLLGTYEIHGFPKDIASARELANNVTGGRLQFEQWIVEVMLDGVLNDKKNKLGYDGYFTFYASEEKHYGFIEVKSGHTDVHDVNHFITTVNDKKAHFGIFVCFADQITRAIKETSKKQGQYGTFKYDKIQIISVEDLMNGKTPQIPESTKTTFKKSAPKVEEEDTQVELGLHK